MENERINYDDVLNNEISSTKSESDPWMQTRISLIKEFVSSFIRRGAGNSAAIDNSIEMADTIIEKLKKDA